MRDAADPQILPVRLCCISCSTSLLLTLMFDIYSHLETWYVLNRGRDKDGCGRSPDSPCATLRYLLQQVNRTHDKELHIVTDKSLVIDQQAAVSTITFICFASSRRRLSSSACQETQRRKTERRKTRVRKPNVERC